MGDRETLAATVVGRVRYTATVEISCPPFTELTVYASGRRVLSFHVHRNNPVMKFLKQSSAACSLFTSGPQCSSPVPVFYDIPSACVPRNIERRTPRPFQKYFQPGKFLLPFCLIMTHQTRHNDT